MDELKQLPRGAAVLAAAAMLALASPNLAAFAQPAALPSPALLDPQPAPDCEFKTTEPKTDELQKLDYERQCYRHAEINVRHRLQLLQVATASASPQPDVKAVQEALKRQGIAVKADGALGKATRAAIRRYQAQQHLQVSGEPDGATLSKLGVGPSARPAQAQVLAQETQAQGPASNPSAPARPAQAPMQPEQMQVLQSMVQILQGQMQMLQSMMQMMQGETQPGQTELVQTPPGPR